MTRRNKKPSRPDRSSRDCFAKRRLTSRRLGSEALEPRWVMAAVTLDTSFGNTTPPVGYSISPIGPGHDAVTDMKIQTWDQKIVVVGEASNTVASALNDLDFFVARYNTDGTLDTGFGAGGSVRTPIGLFKDQASGVDFQMLGANTHKIIAGGYYTVSHSDLRTDTLLSNFVTSDTRQFGTEDVGGKTLIVTNADGRPGGKERPYRRLGKQ